MRVFPCLRGPQASFFTTPIFYVNAAPHIGHLYSMVLADVAHRWSLLNQRQSVLSTGTDEHGMKVAAAAAKAGQPPQQFVDSLSQKFAHLASHAQIDYTRFVRTTDADHKERSVEMWKKLQDRGYLYLSKHSGWYCLSDETFYTELELMTHPETGVKISAQSGNSVEWYEEENWFFKLSALQPQLIEWYKSHPQLVLPQSRHSSVMNELQNTKLEDLSVSRPIERCPWGIPVPGENSSRQTMYVWFEALVNYLTVADSTKANCWPGTHIIGKDITRFHAIYWPAFLLAAGMEPPKQVVVHSHWTLEGSKMSKSRQNVVDPFELIDKFGLDTVRYVLCHDSTLAHDSPFSYDRVVERHNVNLVNKLGNLVSRVCGPKFNVFDALKTCYKPKLPSSALLEQCTKYAASFEFGRYTQIINEAGVAANQALQEAQPWEDPTSFESKQAIAEAADACRLMALLLQPICPTYSRLVLDRLGVADGRRTAEWAVLGKDLDFGLSVNYKGGHVLQRIQIKA